MIVVYIVVLAWGYFAKEHISIYEVNTTDISDDAPLYGFVMRAEEIVNSEESAYINYYLSEGSRIGKGDVAYTEDTSGEVSKMLRTNPMQKRQLGKYFKNAGSDCQLFTVLSTMPNYSEVTKLHYDAENVLMDLNQGNLYSDLKKAMASSGKADSFY